jgi:transcription factor C subunit 6
MWVTILSSREHISTNIWQSEDSNSTRLGLLGGVFEDGSVSVYACPDPLTGTRGERAYGEASLNSQLIPIQRLDLVHLPNPVVKFQLEDAQSTALDWANSELIAIGLSNGGFLHT